MKMGAGDKGQKKIYKVIRGVNIPTWLQSSNT